MVKITGVPTGHSSTNSDTKCVVVGIKYDKGHHFYEIETEGGDFIGFYHELELKG